MRTPIMHKCLKHNIAWRVAPGNILKGCGCVECGNEKIREKNTKTNSEYVEELKKINCNIISLEEYKNTYTPILHKCKICGYEWKIKPTFILSGTRCPNCNKTIRLSNEQFVNKLKEINPNIIPLENYKNTHTKIKFKCLIDGCEWETLSTSVLNGELSCPECRKRYMSKKMSISHEEYISKLKELNENILVVGVYKNSSISVLHRCKICNYEWNALPKNIFRAPKCPCCTKGMKKTPEYMAKRFLECNPNIIQLTEFVGFSTKVKFKCKIDGHIWETLPEVILRGGGCPICANKSLLKTHEQYVQEVININPDIDVIGKYINSDTKILHKCKKDGYEWYAKPSYILSGSGCPVCKESNGERKVRQWLEKNDIEYIYQKVFLDCKDVKPLPFDFYLPDYNMCIEYDGQQHFIPVNFNTKKVDNESLQKQFELIKNHDKIKNNYCKINNIKLLRISYKENIAKKLNNLFT